jgi:hypothetical protein
MLREADLSPRRLGAAIDTALATAPPLVALDVGGAARTAAIVSGWGRAAA